MLSASAYFSLNTAIFETCTCFCSILPLYCVMFLPSAPSPGLHPHPGTRTRTLLLPSDEMNATVMFALSRMRFIKYFQLGGKKNLDHKPWQRPTSVNSTNNIRMEKLNVAALRFCEGLRVEKGLFIQQFALLPHHFCLYP